MVNGRKELLAWENVRRRTRRAKKLRTMNVDLMELEGNIPMHDERYERLSESVNEERWSHAIYSQRTVSTTVAYIKDAMSGLLRELGAEKHSRRHSMEREESP